MAILVIMLAVVVSVALFFILAVKFGRGNEKRKQQADVLDLDSFVHRPTKTPLLADEEDEMIV